MQITFLLAGAIFLISRLPPPVPVDNTDIKAAQKIVGGIAIGTCIGLLGGLLGIGGQVGARIMSTHLKGRSIRIMLSCILFLLTIKMLHQFFVSP